MNQFRDPNETTPEQLRDAWQAFQSAAFTLSNVWEGYPDGSGAPVVNLEAYQRLFSMSFDEWAYELSAIYEHEEEQTA